MTLNKIAEKILKDTVRDINDYILYENYDQRLSFEFSVINSEKEIYTCYSSGMDVQIFSFNEELFFEDDKGNTENISDVISSDDLFIILQDFLDENYNRRSL